MQTVISDKLLRTDEAADYLGLRPCTLETYRTRGGGPVFHRVGRGRGAIRYRMADLMAFVEAGRSTSTAQTATLGADASARA
ncbi:MAG TPA: helix-turn-helix domain-containing protein [Candidatus Hydrogenedentes bacterium]|nr:helix-turn-helix domain-containing protein [Candidatus Hydrogenedentota bacterium]